MDEEQLRREIENLERLINGQQTRIAEKEGLKMRLIQMIQKLENQMMKMAEGNMTMVNQMARAKTQVSVPPIKSQDLYQQS